MSLFHELAGPLYPVLDWPMSTGPNGGYNFWSGVASGGPWIGIFVWYRTRVCHVPWCMRIGRHPTADGHHVLCRKHHPDLPDHKPSRNEIVAGHFAAKADHRP